MYQWRKRNPKENTKLKRRERVRRLLRERGFLPKVGTKMTDEQKKIYEQIGQDDYSFWDSVKLNGGPGQLHNGGNQSKRQPNIKKTKEQLLLERAKQSAQERKYDFNLNINDIIIPKYCPLLNVKLTFKYTPKTKNSYYSIDRIDSKKGYIKGNVQVISLKANTMKNDATRDELLCFAKNVLNLYSV